MNESMPQVTCHKFVVVLLMLVFSSQLLASGHSLCQNLDTTVLPSEHSMHGKMAHGKMMDHSQHAPASAVVSADCCSSGDCSLGGCSATAALPTAEALFTFNLVLLTSHYQQRLDDALAISFLRPPITR